MPHAKFYPVVRDALLIILTLPATAYTVERSFSTLRIVKKWLRLTMSDKRLSGLCMLRVHRDKINTDTKKNMEKVIEKY